MKVFLSLSVLCISLICCDGACYSKLVTPRIVDGKEVVECIDSYDTSVHSLGSMWNSAHCMRCSCGRNAMTCCARYGGIYEKEGCTSIIDEETWTHKHYRINDPTVLC